MTRFAPCVCGHGKSWHMNAKNSCTYIKPRNTGALTGHKGKCECVKYKSTKEE